MRPQVAPNQPWIPERTRFAMRGRALVRLRSGEDPRDVPAHADVLRGAALACGHLDGGPLDRVLRHFSAGAHVSRAFAARASSTTAGRRHLGFADDEERLGLSRTFRIEFDPDASVVDLVDAMRALGTVELAMPMYLAQAPFARPARRAPRHAPEPAAAFDRIGGPAALALEPGDPALIVAIVDSGIALQHAELRGRYRPGVDTVDLPQPQVSRALRLLGDLSGRDRDPTDESGHGTACAGIVGAAGYRVPPGLAGAARLLPIRTMASAVVAGADEPTAIGALADIDAGCKAAIDLGARVLNLSFGTPESALRDGDETPHAKIVEYARARGCTLIAASGNSGLEERYFPAALPGVIAVGAVGNDDRPASFSTRGEHVALSAPGEDIPCLGLAGYSRSSGTSFAAPFVTAACALMHARAARQSTSLDPQAIRAILRRSARPFAGGADAAGCGAGVLDVPKALRLVDELADAGEPLAADLGRHGGVLRG